jgi:hypothetical protein
MKISELLNESHGVAEDSDKYAELSKKIRDLAQAGKEGEANKLRYELNRLLMLDRDKKRRKERGVAEDWNKVNHHDKTNGLSQKAVNAYRHEHPGSHLQTAVTTKPSKLKKGSKAAKRRKSFCARMSGNKGPMKKPNGKPTPKALALRRWNCESIEEMAQMIAEGEQMVAEIKKGQKDSNGFTKCWPGKHAEGTKKGKNGKPVRNCVPNESVVNEKWTQKYKNSINCSNPKGFSQKAHCAGKKK